METMEEVRVPAASKPLALPLAAEIDVYIPDLKHGVPGSELPIWRYREEVDPNWRPGPDYPGIKAEPLPSRRSDLCSEMVLTSLRINRFKADSPKLQASGRRLGIDLRTYTKSQWDNKLQRSLPIPYEEQTTCDDVRTSLFLNTVHYCFANHYPLGIRPECLMWMIVHEVGVTVKNHAEDYRHLFTDSAEKKEISVRVDSLDINNFGQDLEWMVGIGMLYEQLRAHMPSDLTQHLTPAISTHDLQSATATMVAVLDAATPFFSYGMETMCGIPKVRLFGHPQDYDNIVTASKELANLFEKHLGQYFDNLIPVLQEIADTANGRKKPDNDFWSSIYKHYSGSGTDDMDGWITAFVNYTRAGQGYFPKDPKFYDWKSNLIRNEDKWGHGIKRKDMPQHLSMVPFIWHYHSDKHDCRLMGGFLGVDDVDGYATPVLSYAVVRGDQIAQ